MEATILKQSTITIKLKSIKPVWLLILGVIVMYLSHLSWNIDALGWFSMTPFLLYLNLTDGWKSRVLFTLALIFAWSLIVSKIISHPISYFLIPLYSVPISLIHLPGYLIYEKLKNNNNAALIFPSVMIIMEWIQYSFTPLASWGAAAYTQIDNIFIAQTLSLFGMAGLGFLIYWFNSSITNLILTKKNTKLNFYLPLITLTILIIFGHLRFDLSKTKGNKTICVAAVGTNSEIKGLPLPSEESNIKVIETIFDKTDKAAKTGAKLVVWNEAAFYLLPKNEKVWKDSIALLAKNNNTAIVASYVLLISESPLRFENKFVFFDPDGLIRNEYLKHEPVPGEPAVKGTQNITSTNLINSNIGGAICYDYDFPCLAKLNKKADVDILALPSSDWRGIDPLHTKMAAFRAIEQGHSIVRSTRFGLSAAINPYGEMVSQMSSFDENNKIMVSNLPAKRVNTAYSYIGDIVVYFSICFILFVLIFNITNKNILTST